MTHQEQKRTFTPLRVNAFTILELIIVFLFFALLTGLAVPNLVKAYQSWQTQLSTNDTLLKINQLGYYASKNGRTITLSNPIEELILPFNVPENIRLSVDKSIYYYTNGICTGGILTLTNNQVETRYELQAPYCTLLKL